MRFVRKEYLNRFLSENSDWSIEAITAANLSGCAAMNAEWVIDLEGISELTISKTVNNYIEGSIYIYFS